MKKKLLSIILAATMAATVLAGCGSSDSGNASGSGSAAADSSNGGATADTSNAGGSGDNTLTVWTWDPNFNIYSIREAEKIYQKENPDFKLEIVETPWEDMQTNLGTILGSGNLSQLPDILLMQDFAFQKYAITYPDMFTDLTASGIDFSTFGAGKVAESTVNGKNLGVPFDAGTEVACYRKDLLKDAGYTIDDLTDIDWDRFIEIGKDVKAKTGYSLFSTQAGSADFIMQLVQSAGGEIWKADGTPNFVGNDILIKSLETYKELFDTGVMATANDWDSYIATFTSGKTLGTINGCWIIASVQADENQSGLWGLTNMPKLTGVSSATNYSNQGGSTWVVTSNCKNVELASDFFAKTFAGSNELYDTILPGAGAISCWTPAAGSSVYSEPIAFFDGQAIYAEIADFGAKVPGFERGVYFTEANTALANVATNIVNGADIDAELKAAEDTVNFDMGN
ncbi:MAG: carbohydrate ABC transporter substrate-binding protein [Lachnospiraceae bacterium]|nr:carbohydrate ABC transporter substrate-binding protein [Lachnospiraceae bacterium]